MNSEPVISVRGLTKRFEGKVVVDGIDLNVQRGEIFGFLGPNGSGKTTTIRMLCGLLGPDAGEGTCLGQNIRLHSRSIKRRVGYMTQRFSLYEDLTIQENLDFMARMHGLSHRRRRVKESLLRFGLNERRNQLAGKLSGGWKQRLSLAACILHEPELILLDEPTAGVDPTARREFWEQIHALAATGITILVSTHYMDEAERCHRIAYISAGKLLVSGPVYKVIEGSGLHSCRVIGPAGALAEFSAALRARRHDVMVAAFGNTLHMSSVNEASLQEVRLAHAEAPELRFEDAVPTLEDVFIHLIALEGGTEQRR